MEMEEESSIEEYKRFYHKINSEGGPMHLSLTRGTVKIPILRFSEDELCKELLKKDSLTKKMIDYYDSIPDPLQEKHEKILEDLLAENIEDEEISYPTTDNLNLCIEPKPEGEADMMRLLIPDLRHIGKEISKVKLQQEKLAKPKEEADETLKKMEKSQDDLFQKRQNNCFSLKKIDTSYPNAVFKDLLSHYKSIDPKFQGHLSVPIYGHKKLPKPEDDVSSPVRNGLNQLDNQILTEQTKSIHSLKPDMTNKKDQTPNNLPKKGGRIRNVHSDITDKERMARQEQYETRIIDKVKLPTKDSKLANIRWKNKENLMSLKPEGPMIIKRIHAEGIFDKKYTVVDESVFLERKRRVIEQLHSKTIPSPPTKVEDVKEAPSQGTILQETTPVEKNLEPLPKKLPEHNNLKSTTPNRIRALLMPSKQVEALSKQSNSLVPAPCSSKSIETLFGGSRKSNEYYRPFQTKSKDIPLIPMPTNRAQFLPLPRKTSEPMLSLKKSEINTKRKSNPPLSEDERKEAERDGIIPKSKRLIKNQMMGYSDKIGRALEAKNYRPNFKSIGQMHMKQLN